MTYDPKGTYPSPKHIFGYVEWKSTLLRVSYGSKWKTKTKKAHGIQLHPYAHPTPPCGSHHSLPVGSDGGHNQTRQISDESVQGSQSHTGQIWPFTIDLAHHPYNSVCANVRHCDDNRRITVHHNHTGDIPRQYLALSGCTLVSCETTCRSSVAWTAVELCTDANCAAARLQCSLP